MARIKGTAREVVPSFRRSPDLSLRIPSSPLPAPRPRIAQRKGFAQAYYPTSYLEWRDAVAEYLEDIELPGVFTGPLAVYVTFVAPAPRASKLTHPKPDIDNYLKSIFDSLTKCGRVWEDDHQVVAVGSYKRWTKDGEEPHIQVDIWEHPEDTRAN